MIRTTLLIAMLACLLAVASSCGTSVSPPVPDMPNDNNEGKASFRELASGSPPSLIAYSRKMGEYPYENRELYVTGPNGIFHYRLTNNTADDNYPAFSPNGHSLAFVSNLSSGPWSNHDVYKFTPWGGITQLTDEAWQFDSSATDWGPGFITAAQLNTLIGAPFDVVRVIALDPWGAWQKFVNTQHIANYDPAVSQDGSKLCFSARPYGPGYFGSLELYLLYRGETEPVQLTAFGDDPYNIVYTMGSSFDFTGDRVVFHTTYWGGTDIGYLRLNTDPPELVRVTNDPASDVQPCFDPSGLWIVFASNRDGNFELYRIFDFHNPWGIPPPSPGIVRLTDTPQDESNPDWSNYY